MKNKKEIRYFKSRWGMTSLDGSLIKATILNEQIIEMSIYSGTHGQWFDQNLSRLNNIPEWWNELTEEEAFIDLL